MTTTTDALLPEWSLGDRLRKARQSAGLSRSEMRSQLFERGITAALSTLSAWETDAARPGHGKDLLKVIAAWADITRVPTSWLLGIDVPAGGGSPGLDRMPGDEASGWAAGDSNSEPAELTSVAA